MYMYVWRRSLSLFVYKISCSTIILRFKAESLSCLRVARVERVLRSFEISLLRFVSNASLGHGSALQQLDPLQCNSHFAHESAQLEASFQLQVFFVRNKHSRFSCDTQQVKYVYLTAHVSYLFIWSAGRSLVCVSWTVSLKDFVKPV